MSGGRGKTLDRCDRMTRRIFNWRDATPNGRDAVRHDGAGAAYAFSATVLGARQIKQITQHPKQRHRGIVHCNGVALAVYVKRVIS